MKEITLFDYESRYDEIMEDVNNGQKYLVKVSPTEGIILTNQKDHSIEYSEKLGLIEKFE
jgi:hypothetical protein